MADRVDEAFGALEGVESPLTWADVTARPGREPLDGAIEIEPSPRRERRGGLLVGFAAAIVIGLVVMLAGPWTGSSPNPSSDPGPAQADEEAVRTAALGWLDTQPRDAVGEFVEDLDSIRGSIRAGMAQHDAATLAGFSGRVTSIQITSPRTAAIRYSVLSGGSVLYPDVRGTVVKVGSRWKVSRDTVCALLARGGVTCPPRSAPAAGALPLPQSVLDVVSTTSRASGGAAHGEAQYVIAGRNTGTRAVLGAEIPHDDQPVYIFVLRGSFVNDHSFADRPAGSSPPRADIMTLTISQGASPEVLGFGLRSEPPDLSIIGTAITTKY